MNKTLLIVLLAVICFTFVSAQETEADIKIGKLLGKVGKGALQVGKAYVGQKYGIQLADEEEESDKKVKFDDIINWVGKGKQIYDILKNKNVEEVEADIKIGKLLGKVGKGALQVGKAYVGQKYGIQLADEEEESDKIKFDEIISWVGKGKQIYDILKNKNAEVESDLNVDEIFEWLGKGKQIYELFKKHKQPVEEPVAEEESDIKFGKILKSVGKGALKVGKAYVGQKYGIQLSDSENSGNTAANFARQQVGKGYSQAARLGPNSFDCSGLVKQAWAAAGRSVPNTTSGYPGGLRRVNDLQPGDILWRSGHVGIYVGNNQVVNAENPRSGVQIRDINWYRQYIGVSAIYRP